MVSLQYLYFVKVFASLFLRYVVKLYLSLHYLYVVKHMYDIVTFWLWVRFLVLFECE